MADEKKVEPKKELPQVRIEGGLLQPQNMDELWRYCTALVQSGMLPKGYTTPAQVMTGLQFARELGLPGLVGLKSIAVINGTPSLHTDAPLALVKASGKLEYIREYFIDKEYNEICIEKKNLDAKIFAAICTTKRKDGDVKTTTFLTVDAPLDKPIWKQYFDIMMKRRCRSINLKDQFPDVLMGASIAEYDHDTIVRESGIVEGQSEAPTTSELNAAFEHAKKEVEEYAQVNPVVQTPPSEKSQTAIGQQAAMPFDPDFDKKA